jgi:hypothetical protein
MVLVEICSVMGQTTSKTSTSRVLSVYHITAINILALVVEYLDGPECRRGLACVRALTSVLSGADTLIPSLDVYLDSKLLNLPFLPDCTHARSCLRPFPSAAPYLCFPTRP